MKNDEKKKNVSAQLGSSISAKFGRTKTALSASAVKNQHCHR